MNVNFVKCLKDTLSVALLGFILMVSSGVKAQADNVKWALLGVNSNEQFHDGLAIFMEKVDGVYLSGAINTQGKVVIEPIYKSLYDFHSGYAEAQTTDGRSVIINTHGYILYDAGKAKLFKNDEFPGVFKVEKDGKYGLFYESSLVIPVEYDYLDVGMFPFISLKKENNSKYVNLVDGKSYDSAITYGNIIIAKNQSSLTNYYYDTQGEPIDENQYKQSSKGVELFYDAEAKLYGLKNSRTNEIITNPIYIGALQGIWFNDMLVMYKKGSPGDIIIDPSGKEVLEKGVPSNVQGDYLVISSYDHRFYYGLYHKNGEEVLPMKYDLITPYELDGWYHLELKETNTDYLYNVDKNILIEGSFTYSDNMFWEMHKDYYVNATTGKIIDKGFESCSAFSEGLAKVKFKNRDFYDIIDRSGKVVIKGSEKLQIWGNRFSEGVIAAKQQDGLWSTVNGYIYNPLGHDGYNYEQTDYSEAMINKWRDEAMKEFEKEHYGKAKDLCYRIMMNRPDDVTAVKNYGLALYNLGYTEQALEAYYIAQDMDPDDEWTQQRIEKAEETLAQEREQDQENQKNEGVTNTDRFINALNAFGNMLGSMANSMSSGSVYDSYSSNFSEPSSNTTTGFSTYQSRYQQWENRASSVYSSLTNLGYSVKDKSGNRSGGTASSMSSSNYIRQKQLLREAQREMQRIRREAARNGVTIQQSKWETATVSY